MILLYYFFRYAQIMIIGYLIKYIGITDIFSLPCWMMIIYNYIAILYGIKRPLEERKDIKYSDILFKLIVLSTILNTIIIYISNNSITCWIILCISNIIELILSKPRYEKNIEQIQKNINDYFKK